MSQETNYIFCINAGRSGSNYLKNIFKQVSDCRPFHEYKPIGNGKVMRSYAQGDIEPMKQVAHEKVKIIKKFERDYRVYAETNHCFIKGFGWFLPQYLPEERIGVLILKRDKSEIAKSFMRIYCSPLRPFGRDWVSTPDMKNPLMPPPAILLSPKVTYHFARLVKLLIGGVRFVLRKAFQQELSYPKWLTNYELEALKWYVDETYARGEAFKRKYRKIKYYEVNIKDLNSMEAVERMLTYFGLTAKDSLNDIVGKPTNLKLGKST